MFTMIVLSASGSIPSVNISNALLLIAAFSNTSSISLMFSILPLCVYTIGLVNSQVCESELLIK